MEQAKHTPGKWELSGVCRLVGDPSDEYGQHLLYVGEVRVLEHVGAVAYIQSSDHCDTGIKREVAEANARLIAAAPTMYQTLTDMDGWLSACGYAEDHPWRISLRAAISMATGGSVL